MSLISDAKNLYVVDDRTTIKNYINRDVDYWVKMDTVPTLEQVIEDLFDNDEFICQPYEESKRLANKDWLEMLSVYSIAKNIQNLVSFNIPDDFDESFYGSKNENNMKLIVKENYNHKSTNKLKNENISVAYDKPNGKTGIFLLDFSDTRSLFRELEDVAGYDFSHQVEQEFYSWKEELAYVATGLKEDCKDISDTISEIRKSVDDLYESGKANEIRSELFYTLEQLDELKKMVTDTSEWSNELNYILTGTGLDD